LPKGMDWASVIDPDGRLLLEIGQSTTIHSKPTRQEELRRPGWFYPSTSPIHRTETEIPRYYPFDPPRPTPLPNLLITPMEYINPKYRVYDGILPKQTPQHVLF
jgi:hypothetical protein